MTLNTVLWVLAGFLGVAFTLAGVTLLAVPKERYARIHRSQRWADDFTAPQLKAIATIKVLGGLGLLVPAVGDIASGLVPVAACGLALFMAGAGATRLRRGELHLLVGDVVFLALFVLVAWGRFGPEPFV